jgi:hypothetical protein
LLGDDGVEGVMNLCLAGGGVSGSRGRGGYLLLDNVMVGVGCSGSMLDTAINKHLKF